MCDGKGVVFPAVWGVTLNDAGGSEWVTVYNPETGLYDHGARYRDPKLGGWLSVDPPMARGEYFPSGTEKEIRIFREWVGCLTRLI